MRTNDTIIDGLEMFLDSCNSIRRGSFDPNYLRNDQFCQSSSSLFCALFFYLPLSISHSSRGSFRVGSGRQGGVSRSRAGLASMQVSEKGRLANHWGGCPSPARSCKGAKFVTSALSERFFAHSHLTWISSFQFVNFETYSSISIRWRSTVRISVPRFFWFYNYRVVLSRVTLLTCSTVPGFQHSANKLKVCPVFCILLYCARLPMLSRILQYWISMLSRILLYCGGLPNCCIHDKSRVGLPNCCIIQDKFRALLSSD